MNDDIFAFRPLIENYYIYILSTLYYFLFFCIFCNTTEQQRERERERETIL